MFESLKTILQVLYLVVEYYCFKWRNYCKGDVDNCSVNSYNVIMNVISVYFVCLSVTSKIKKKDVLLKN